VRIAERKKLTWNKQ